MDKWKCAVSRTVAGRQITRQRTKTAVRYEVRQRPKKQMVRGRDNAMQWGRLRSGDGMGSHPVPQQVIPVRTVINVAVCA